MQGDLKIVVVGPPGSGKTEICNILSNATKGFQGNCKPTVGLRILEYSMTLNNSAFQTTIPIQLWDTSGDEKYSGTWPAIAKDVDGCAFIYNAYDKNQSKQIENYVKKFAKDMGLEQCCVVAHKIGEVEPGTKASRPKLPRTFENIKVMMADIKNGADPFIDEISNWFGIVHQSKMRKIEEQERQMVGDSQPKKKKESKNEVEELRIDD